MVNTIQATSDEMADEFANKEVEGEKEPESLTGEGETKEVTPPSEPMIPKYRFDEVNEARKKAEVKAESMKELEAMGYSLDEIKEFLQNPDNKEVIDSVKLRTELRRVNESTNSLTQKVELNDFILSNPEAKEFREPLIRLKKAYPEKSVEDLYQEVVNPIVARSKTKTTSETGRGSKGDLIPPAVKFQNLTFGEIESLPPTQRKEVIRKQKEYLKKLGF